jgi:esterase
VGGALSTITVQEPGARPRHTALVLHGILGSGQNWRTFARRLAATHPQWRFVLPDLPNHGRSSGFGPPHTVAGAAARLADLARGLDEAPTVCIGHSYGGKVALAYARDSGGAIREVWALDSPPGATSPADAPEPADAPDAIGRVLAALRRVSLPVARREEVVEQLGRFGVPDAVGQWMTTNLEATEGGYRWRFDLDAIEAMVADYIVTDLWPVVEAPPADLRVGLVIADAGGRFGPADIARADSAAAANPGRVEVHHLPGAGHWVHVDAPDALASILGAVLSRGQN